MNIVRRRLATLTVAAMTVVGGAVALAPPASAADITSISPMVVSNTESRTLTISVSGATTGGATGTLTLSRSDAPTETIIKSVSRSAGTSTNQYVTSNGGNPFNSPSINFATARDGQPANPGQYNASLTTQDLDPEGQSTSTTFTCTACFTVDAPSLFTSVDRIVPSSVPAGATQTVTINGSGFAQATTVVALPNSSDTFTGTDPSRNITFTHVSATPTQLRKAVRVGDQVAPGKRTLRLTNTNGNRFDCIDCFTVTGPELTGVFPISAANDGVKTIRFTAAQGVTLTEGSTMRLEYLFGGVRNPALDIVGTAATLNAARTEISGQFDLVGAAPNREAYQPVVVRPDGSGSSCTCRFSVLQGSAPTPTAVSPATVPANSTRTLTVTGTGFARGAKVSTAVVTPPSISADRIVVTSVEYVSTTRLLVTINIPSNAQMGTRDLTVTNTDGQSGTCEECFEVAGTQSASPSPSATPTATVSPRPSASATATPTQSATRSPSPSATASATRSPSPSPSNTCTTPATVSLDVTTITATGGANVTVRGTANSVVDLFAYSRPSSTYRLVRSGDVGPDGAETYRITPPTNTRLYAQQRGCTTDEPSASRVLNVRTQISLNVVRNGTRNYTFSGRLLPARPNGLIASLYRVTDDGRQILAAQQRANAAPGQAGYDPSRPEGSYSIRRQFTGSGRFGFVVRTGQDLQNAPGSSNVRSLAVF